METSEEFIEINNGEIRTHFGQMNSTKLPVQQGKINTQFKLMTTDGLVLLKLPVTQLEKVIEETEKCAQERTCNKRNCNKSNTRL